MTRCCNGLVRHFDEEKVQEERARLTDEGPVVTTVGLLTMLRAEGVEGATLLDVGAGLGSLQDGLFGDGLEGAVHLEASPAFSEAARELAAERGYADRVEYRVGDAIEVAADLPPSDIVVLDRVICCYPAMEPLVRETAGRAERLYAASFPRDRWTVRLGMGVENLVRRITSNPFRSFVHPVGEIDGVLREEGFERRRTERTFVWEMAVYQRVAGGRGAR